MYLAIDIGGTKTLVAQIDKTDEIVSSQRFETPQSYPEFLAKIKSQLDNFGKITWHGAAAGVPCPINYVDDSFSQMINLAW